MATSTKHSDRRSRRRKQHEPSDDDPEGTTLLQSPPPPTDGLPNRQQTAPSSSPLLVRPNASIQEPASRTSKNKARRKPRLLASPSLRARTSARNQETKPSTARVVTRQARPPRASSIWGVLSTCVCLTKSFAPLVSETELPSLSTEAQNRLASLDATTTRSGSFEMTVHHTDQVPLGLTSASSSFDQPHLVVHLVDVCTGHPLAPPQETPVASWSQRSTRTPALEWKPAPQVQWTTVDLAAFLSPRTIVLVELVQRRKPTKKARQLPAKLATKPSTSAAATTMAKHCGWCFFKPVSAHGNLRLPSLSGADEPSTLRLQLHAWQPLSWMDDHHAQTLFRYNSRHDPASGTAVPAVFLQYQKRTKQRIASSLHIALHPVLSTSRLHQITPIAEQQTAEATNDSSDQPRDMNSGDNQLVIPPESVPSQREATTTDAAAPATPTPAPLLLPPILDSAHDPLLRCKRMPGESCLIPHRVLHRLPTGRNGCSSLTFSPDGLFLAAAVHQRTATADEWVIHIHQTNSGVLWQLCRGHQGMIHSLEWGLRVDGVKALVSASSDGSAMLWTLQDDAQISAPQVALPSRVWQHVPRPAFVYAAAFHTTQPRLVVTGASDGVVRLWDTGDLSTRQPYTSTPLHQWNVVDGAVHCLSLEPATGRVFCGDSMGTITVWTPSASGLSFELTRTVRTGQRSIASLRLHPRKKHLQVLTHPHALLQYELRSFLLLHKSYTGIECDQLLVKASFSPDGQFVVCGSEDGVPHLFDSLHGQRVDDATSNSSSLWGRSFFHGYPILEIAWSPAAHIVALAAYGGNHPVVVMAAFRDDRIHHEFLDGAGFSTKSGSHRAHPDKVRLDAALETAQMQDLERREQRLQQKLAREMAAAASVASTPRITKSPL